MTDLASHDVPDRVDPTRWQLRVTGAVETELAVDREDLESLPIETYRADFTCIEGWVADDLAWRGVRVGDLLDRATPTAASSHALVQAMDGEYACSFPLDRLAAAVLAVELDGDPLPVEHGGRLDSFRPAHRTAGRA